MRQLVRGETEGDRFRFAFLIVTVMYGVTEAVVRQNLIWLGLLLVASRSLPGCSQCCGPIPSPVPRAYPLLIRCRAEHRPALDRRMILTPPADAKRLPPSFVSQAATRARMTP